MNHNTAIIQHLEDRGRITPMEALRKFGCFRLSARIYDLRKMGYDIVTESVTRKSHGVVKTFARYSLR